LFLENKFNEQEVGLEDFIKNIRKIEEAKFEEKALLAKCLKQDR
jgi:hypothetical protein